MGQEVPAADPTFTGDETIPEREVPIHEHHTNVVAETAKLQHKPAHNLGRLAWKLASSADTFGVTAGEATP